MIRKLRTRASTAKLLLLLGLFLSAQFTFAQGKSQESLARVLTKIESKYGVTFIFEKSLIQGMTSAYTLPVNETKPLDEVLKAILYPKSLLFLYVKKGHYAIIKNDKPELDVSVPQNTNAAVSADQQKRTVNGKITDITGIPLPGVSIKPEGSKYAVSSSSDGSYSITFDKSYKSLEFSYVGMISQHIELDASSLVNVKLASDENMLKEVEILSTGYEKIPKERATGSFGFISAKEIAKTPSINLMERLEGKIPGVKFDIRNNRITVRSPNGYSATGANSQPLIVVDGFPLISESSGDQQLTKLANSVTTSNSIISRINPDDIESITFLKDAAAASIWGSKAANGVIVIETKKGGKKEPSINFNTALNISASPNLKNLNAMNSAQYINLEQELFTKGFVTDPGVFVPDGYNTFNIAPNTSDALEWMFRVRRGTATPAQRDAALSVLSNQDNTQQKKDYLLQNAVGQQYNVSVSGGGENGTYYLSGNATNDKPIFRGNNAKSYNFTVNTTTDFFKKRITLTTGLTYNNSASIANRSAAAALNPSSTGLRPYDLLVDDNGNHINRYIFFRPEVIDDFTSKGYLPWTYNAIDELNYSNVTSKENRVRANAGIKAKILDWLDVNVSGVYQSAVAENVSYDELNSYIARTTINIGTSISGGKLVYGVPLGGIYATTNNSNNDYSLRGSVNVHKTWNIHQLNIIAGSDIRQTQSRSFGQTRYGFNDDTYAFASVNPSVNYQTIYPYTQNLGGNSGTITAGKLRYLSYFSNASYSLMDKYVASASIRYEDYTQMGAEASLRGKPFWSAGLKWNVKKEDFMQSVKVISDLNLRLTYGTGGTIPSAGFNTTVISLPGIDPLTNKPYAAISSPANSEISWELTKQLNGGVDMNLFNNRLGFSFDIYSKRSSGIAVSLPFNATYGYSNVEFNAATLSSHGLEFGIHGTILKQNSFNWNSNLTFAYSNNKVTDTRYPAKTDVSLVTSSSAMLGFPLDYMYVYKWAGLDEKGQSQIYDKNNNIIKNTTNLTTATFGVDDLTYIGRRTAPYYGGWSNDFSYQNFTLNVMMSYYMGGHFLKSSIDNYPTFAGTYSGAIGTQTDLDKRWRVAGDELTTDVPGLTGINNNSIVRYKNSDLLVRSSSHVRLQQISLGYSIPFNLIQHTPFKSVSASVSARNLGIIWRKNKDGIDPDYIASNTVSNLPPTRNFTFGLNASF